MVTPDGGQLIDVVDTVLTAGQAGLNVFDGRAAYQAVLVAVLG
jgi:levanase